MAAVYVPAGLRLFVADLPQDATLIIRAVSYGDDQVEAEFDRLRAENPCA